MPIDTNQSDVLAALVKLLADKLLLNERYCFETTEPLQEFGNPPSGDFWVTVSPGESSFEEGQFQAGGGASQCVEFLEATIIGFTRIRLDSTDRDTRLLHDLRRGLTPIKAKLLATVVGQQLTNDAGDELLRNLMYSKRGFKAGYDKEQATGWIGIVVGLDYDWDLASALP